ncbi:MAG: AbrB/MazE/SpoVT family DNA-binding domain-containing protein [Candidatus Sulfotelmatobacter sp.]
MNNSSTISSKGQITVPQEIRKRLGLQPGDRVEFVAEEGRTVIRPVRTEVNPFERFIGIASPFPGGEEGIKAWIDDMRSDKDYE